MAKSKNAASGADLKKVRPKKVPKELAKSRAAVRFIQEGSKKPKQFFQELGLAEDPNKVIGKKKRAKLAKDPNSIRSNKIKKAPKETPATKFVRELEEKANKPTKKNFKFGKVMCAELEYYIQKYGDDYQAMARDKKNIYQDSPGQLRQKIIKYNKIHKNRRS